MKTTLPSRRPYALILTGSLAALLATPATQAATLYWDTNGTTAGSASSSVGTWGTSNYWNTDSTGGSGGTFQTTNTSDDDLTFVAAPSATSGNSTSTITVSGVQSANSITIKSNGALTFSGGQINLGSGGIVISQYAYGTTNNGSVVLSSTVNLTTDQTWTNSLLSGNLLIQGGLTGVGNLVITSNNGGTSAATQFKSGASTGWTGSLTMDGGNLLFANSTQLTTRLNNSTLTLKNDASAVSLKTTVLNTNAVTNFTNNIVFGGSSNTNTYAFNIGVNTGAVLSLSGNLSGILANSLVFRTGVDFSGTGALGQYRISGNNSGLTASPALATSGSAIAIESGYVVLDSKNALGANNSLSVLLGRGATTAYAFGLFSTSGNDVAANITVSAAKTASLVETAYLGLDGVGSVLYSGSIQLTRGGSSVANSLHLRALAGGTATFSGKITDLGASGSFSSIIVDGGGKVVLTDNSTYAGNTIVSAGTLLIGNGATGSISSSSAISSTSTGILAFNQATGSTISNAIDNEGEVHGAQDSGITNTFSGVISGTGSFTQTGAGTSILTNANTYTGATTVSVGELDVNGSLAASSTVNVDSGATLGGSGNVYGAVTVANGSIKGNGLTVASGTFTGYSTLAGTSAATNGYTVMSGTTNVTGTTASNVNVASGLLKGTGRVGNITVSGTLGGTLTTDTLSGSGLVSPGNSPGTLTVASLASDNTLSFAFELATDGLTYTSGSNGNDLLHVTNSSSGLNLSGSNAISIYFSSLTDTGILSGTYQGTFYVEGLSGASLLSEFNTANTKYYVVDSDWATSGTSGDVLFSGTYYSLLSNQFVTVAAPEKAISDFSTGTKASTLEFTVVPEPNTWAMIVGGLGMLAFGQRLRRQRIM